MFTLTEKRTGILKFFCPHDFAGEEMLRTVHLLSLDRSMVPVTAELEGNLLQVHFPLGENLRLCVPWTIPNAGNKMLTTGTLIPSETPYYLSIELARGLCATVRNQASDWDVQGLAPTENFTNAIQEAGRYLFYAIKLAHGKTEYDPEVDKYANYVLRICTKASLILVKNYIERVLVLRKIAKESAEAAASFGSARALTQEKGERPAFTEIISPTANLEDHAPAEALRESFNGHLTAAQGFDENSSGRNGTKPQTQAQTHSETHAEVQAELLDDDDFAARFLQDLETQPVNALNDDESLDISGDDTAIHVIETVAPKFVGVHVDHNLLEKEVKEIFFQTFNHVTIEMSWKKIHDRPDILQAYDRQIDWCYSNGFSVTVGPIVNFTEMHLPEFMLDLFKGDFETICGQVRKYVEQIVKRYRSKVSTWVAASRVNTSFLLGLTLLQQLELNVKIVSWIRQFHPTAEVLTSLDMPWGDNILPAPFGVEDEENKQYPTIACADYLLRSKCKLAGFQLEFNVGYQYLATYDRPILEWSRMIDRWSGFGVPLYLMVRVPSSCEPDPKALVPCPPIWDGWSMRTQALWASNIIPVLLAKPNVYGVDWCVFRDYRTHDYPNSGLITRDGRVKKVQMILADILKYFVTDTI